MSRITRRAALALPALAAPAYVRGQGGREIRFGSAWSTTATPHVALVEFARQVEAKTQGRIRVRVYPDSQLGDIQALINGLQLGTVDMSYLAIGNAGVLRGGAPLNVAYTPYLFASKSKAEQTANTPIFREMYDALAAQSGVRIFAVYGQRSPRAVHNSVRPVNRAADINGLRLRIPPIDGIRLMFEKLGARPVVLGLGDTYMAISRGQVDGHENGLDAAVGFRWYEVAKHWAVTDHIFETAAWYVNERLWASLGPADREMLIECARIGGVEMSKAGEALDSQAITTLQNAGVAITRPDLEEFRTLLRDVHLASEGRVWPAGLVDRIRAQAS